MPAKIEIPTRIRFVVLYSQEEKKMSKRTILLMLVVGVVFLGSTAQGVLVSFVSDAGCNWSPSGVVMLQGMSGGAVGVTMTAEAQSTFTITTTATNESDITWTGYLLSLDPQGNASFVDGSAGSTKFNTALYPDAHTIEFWEPQVVLPTQVVTLQFDVSIPDDGTYTFTLTQNPIPEPTTMLLLGFGGALLLHKRPRNK
jgi:hypothetical protein